MNNCNRCYKEIKLGDKVKIICTDCFSKIADLEAKLAESEKRFQDHKQVDAKIIQDQGDLIEKLKSENHALMSDNAYQEAEIFELTQKVATQNQDKIAFAVEQLEKVKEFVNETSGIVGHEWRIDRFRVLEHIENQIKQLKGEQ